MQKNIIGLSLLDYRTRNDLTQQRLCNLLNINRTSYSYYETGKREPDITVLKKLANFYKTSIDSLVGNTVNIANISEGTPPYGSDFYKDCHELLLNLKKKKVVPSDLINYSKSEFELFHSIHNLSIEDYKEIELIVKYKSSKSVNVNK